MRYNSLECFDVSQKQRDCLERTLKQTMEVIQRITNCYFQATQLESDMTAYKQAVCQHFITKHPKLTTRLTEQNVTEWDRPL